MRCIAIAAFLAIALFVLPAIGRRLDDDVHERRDLLGRRARARPSLRPGRPGLARAGRPARGRGLDGDAAALRHRPAVPGPAARHGVATCLVGVADRPAGAPPRRPPPGPDHAHGRRRVNIVARRDQLPERRRRVHRAGRTRPTSPASRPCAGLASARATPPTTATSWSSRALMFLLALLHVRGKPGRAWAAIRESEPAALAAGVNITPLQALGVRARSVHGGRRRLPARRAGRRSRPFSRSRRRTHSRCWRWSSSAASTASGARSSRALFNQLLPVRLPGQWGVNPNFLLIIFGVGLLQVLLTAPGGLADQVPKDLAKLGRLLGAALPERPSASRRARA